MNFEWFKDLESNVQVALLITVSVACLSISSCAVLTEKARYEYLEKTNTNFWNKDK